MIQGLSISLTKSLLSTLNFNLVVVLRLSVKRSTRCVGTSFISYQMAFPI